VLIVNLFSFTCLLLFVEHFYGQSVSMGGGKNTCLVYCNEKVTTGMPFLSLSFVIVSHSPI